MNHEITEKLVVIIACYAALAFVGTRRWIRPAEAIVVGAAMIFWAIAWLTATLIKVTVPIYGPGWRPALVAIVMTIPMALAMAVGLWFLVRRMKRPASSAPASPQKSRRKRNDR